MRLKLSKYWYTHLEGRNLPDKMIATMHEYGMSSIGALIRVSTDRIGMFLIRMPNPILSTFQTSISRNRPNYSPPLEI